MTEADPATYGKKGATKGSAAPAKAKAAGATAGGGTTTVDALAQAVAITTDQLVKSDKAFELGKGNAKLKTSLFTKLNSSALSLTDKKAVVSAAFGADGASLADAYVEKLSEAGIVYDAETATLTKM